jgi:hypothetical protein
VGNAFQVLVGQCLDGGIFRFANPGDFELHESDLNTKPKLGALVHVARR